MRAALIPVNLRKRKWIKNAKVVEDTEEEVIVKRAITEWASDAV